MPCTSGQVSGTSMSVMRDTGYTVCMARSSPVKTEQMTGSYDWCVLVNGTMKWYPTAVGPALVAQLAETQCTPTGMVCRRSRGSIPGSAGRFHVSRLSTSFLVCLIYSACFSLYMMRSVIVIINKRIYDDTPPRDSRRMLVSDSYALESQLAYSLKCLGPNLL